MLPSFAFPTPSQWTDFLARFPDESYPCETWVAALYGERWRMVS